jgi:hypothetical protein
MNGTSGFPTFYWYGKEGDYMVLVMEMLGPTLEELLNFCNRKFTLHTSLMITDQLVYITQDYQD